MLLASANIFDPFILQSYSSTWIAAAKPTAAADAYKTVVREKENVDEDPTGWIPLKSSLMMSDLKMETWEYRKFEETNLLVSCRKEGSREYILGTMQGVGVGTRGARLRLENGHRS